MPSTRRTERPNGMAESSVLSPAACYIYMMEEMNIDTAAGFASGNAEDEESYFNRLTSDVAVDKTTGKETES